MEIPLTAYEPILHEINSDPSLQEKHRSRNLTFGIIHRRNESMDYSRNNWIRGKLYSCLLQFAEKYVTVPFDSISIGFGDSLQFRRLKNSRGLSFFTACGNFTGGELTVNSGDLSGNHQLFQQAVCCDFSKHQYCLQPFQGKRITLLFYKFYCKQYKQLPKWDLREERGEWFFYKGETKMGKNGKKKKTTKYESNMTIIRGDIQLRWD